MVRISEYDLNEVSVGEEIREVFARYTRYTSRIMESRYGPPPRTVVEMGESSGSGGVGGVNRRRFGRIPELLGFSEEEIRDLGLSRSGRRGRRGGYGGNRSARSGRRGGRGGNRGGRGGRIVRRGRNDSGGRRINVHPPVRTCLIHNINREPHNQPLPVLFRRPPPPTSRPVGYIPPIPRSYHRRMMDESTENREGRFHPEDGRLWYYGIMEEIARDLRLDEIPPAWFPRELISSDSSWSSDSSTSSSESPGTYLILPVFLIWLVCGVSGRSYGVLSRSSGVVACGGVEVLCLVDFKLYA